MPVRSVENVVAEGEDLLEAFPPVTSAVSSTAAAQIREEYRKYVESAKDTLADPDISTEDRNRIEGVKYKVMVRHLEYAAMAPQPGTGFLGFGARRRRTSKKKKTLRRRKRTSRR